MISISVDVEGRKHGTLDFEIVRRDVLVEDTSVVRVANNVATLVQACAILHHLNLDDLRFKVLRLNPDNSGQKTGPIFTTVVLDSDEALRGVTNLLAMIVNEQLAKRRFKGR